MGAGVERGAERHSQLRNRCLPSGAARPPPPPPPDLPGPGRVNSTLQPTSPPPRSPVPTSLDSSGRIRPREYPGSLQTARPLDTLPPGLRPRWGCRVPKEARVQRLENDRCPEGGLELQVTGAGPRGKRAQRRCPFPALPRADLLRPRVGCALGTAVLPQGAAGRERRGPPTLGDTPTLSALPTATARCRIPPAARNGCPGERGRRGRCLVRWRSFCRSLRTLWPSSWARRTAPLRRSPGPFSLHPRPGPNPGSSPDTTSATRSSPISKRRTCNTSGTRRSPPRWPRLFSWAGSTSRSC